MSDEQINEEYDEDDGKHRYLFTVRQAFGQEPRLDTFYELTVPVGLTGDQALLMTKLDGRFCQKEISADTQALQGMGLRLRFNSDAYPDVCLVRTHCEITDEELESILLDKHRNGTLIEFLDDAAVTP